MYRVCISPSSSKQMAEEVLKSGPMEGEGGEGEGRAAFEGMEALARAIETGKASLRKTLPPLTIYMCTLIFP